MVFGTATMRGELPGMRLKQRGRGGIVAGCSTTVLCGMALLVTVLVAGNYILVQRRNCDAALNAAQDVRAGEERCRRVQAWVTSQYSRGTCHWQLPKLCVTADAGIAGL
jgi:hypothetical protein